MKIIIPMAGIGKRLGPLTQHKPKALVRLADKRLIDHVLDTFQELEKAHTLEYIFIIGYLAEQIERYMKEAHPDKKVTYFRQEELMGQSHAVHLAKEAISGPVLLTYCDTLNKIDFSFLSEESLDGVAAVLEVDDPSRHGVAVASPDNLVTKLVEKPKTLEHKAALTGLYYFSEGKELIKAIEIQIKRKKSLNNEYYLADAINILVENGMRIKAQRALQWIDAGTPEDMLQTNAHLLKDHRQASSSAFSGGSNQIIPPVYIHESSHVENSIIGPNVAIGKKCSIRGSILRNSIVDDGSVITDISLANSLIGEDCSISANPIQTIMADRDEQRVSYSIA